MDSVWTIVSIREDLGGLEMELEKINNLDHIYYLEDGEKIWSSIEEYLENKQEEYEGIKDNIEIWEEEQLEKLEEYTGREIINQIILKKEEEIEFYKNLIEKGKNND